MCLTILEMVEQVKQIQSKLLHQMVWQTIYILNNLIFQRHGVSEPHAKFTFFDHATYLVSHFGQEISSICCCKSPTLAEVW